MSRLSAVRVGAVSVVIAHLAVLMLLRGGANSVLASNTLQLLSALLAGFAYLYVFKKTRGDLRIFAALIAATFFVFSLAQSGWLYKEGVLRQAVETTSNINVLFFFFMAPMPMALFIPPRFTSRADRWTLVLDTVQLGIALVSAYLFFFYAPSIWQRNSRGMDVAIRHSSEWRNWLMLFIYLGTCVFSKRRSLRVLCSTQLLFLFTYAVGETFYFHATPTSVINTGKFFDLTWSIPFAASTFFANRLLRARVQERTSLAYWTTKTTAFHLLPGLVPVLIVAMAFRATKEHAWVAAGAVGASFMCFVLRLYLTQHATSEAFEAAAQSDARLAASEKRFASAFHLNPIMMGILQLPDRTILDVNQRFLDFYGGSREQVLRRNGVELGISEGMPERDTFLSEILLKEGKPRVDV